MVARSFSASTSRAPCVQWLRPCLGFRLTTRVLAGGETARDFATRWCDLARLSSGRSWTLAKCLLCQASGPTAAISFFAPEFPPEPCTPLNPAHHRHHACCIQLCVVSSQLTVLAPHVASLPSHTHHPVPCVSEWQPFPPPKEMNNLRPRTDPSYRISTFASRTRARHVEGS